MPSLRQQWEGVVGAAKDEDSHESPGARFGLMFVPLVYIFGDSYRNFITKGVDKGNELASKVVKPIDKFMRKASPLHGAVTDTPEGADAADWIGNKPVSTSGIVYGLASGIGALGGAGGAGGGSGSAVGGEFALPSMNAVGGGNAGALAASGGIQGGAGLGAGGYGASTAGTGGLGSLTAGDYMKLAQQGMGGGQQQQQAPFPQLERDIQQGVNQIGSPQMPPTMGQRIQGGLGKLRDGLTPVDPRVAATMDPAYLQQLRNNAMLQMGLGMMSTAHQGGRFGESLASGLGQAQGGFGRGIENAYQVGKQERQEKRLDERQALEDARYGEGLGYERNRDLKADERSERDFKATQEWRKEQLKSLKERAEIRSKPPGASMSDKAIDFAARRLLNGEPANKVLANFGRGAQGAQNITAVQNRLADLAAEGNVSPQLMAVITQELAADSRTRLELGAREGKVAARVEEAKQFAGIAGQASVKVPRGQFVPVNRLLQYTDTQLSSPELAAFKAANVSLINAYAAAVGGGVPTVHDKEAAEAMLSTAQSPEAYQAVVNQLITEMDAALAAPRNVMESMREHDVGHGAPAEGVVNWEDLK